MNKIRIYFIKENIIGINLNSKKVIGKNKLKKRKKYVIEKNFFFRWKKM